MFKINFSMYKQNSKDHTLLMRCREDFQPDVLSPKFSVNEADTLEIPFVNASQ
jgi:hypothetical protein